MTEASAAKPDYAVKAIETIAAGTDVLARLYTLAPGDVIPWHFHNHVSDWYFCLAGQLSVETRAPRAHQVLDAGDRYEIPARTAHRISNAGAEDCRFLLLQGVGQYDFVKVG